MSTHENSQKYAPQEHEEYAQLFYDLVEPYLPKVGDDTFAEKTMKLGFATNDALQYLRSIEVVEETLYGHVLTNQERAEYLVSCFSASESLESTAYLVRSHLFLRKWSHEDVGYLLDLALTKTMADALFRGQPGNFSRMLNTQRALTQRVHMPPQHP